MKIIDKRFLVKEDKFIQDVEKHKKWEPGEGFFTDNSAEKIASGAVSGHDGDIGAAIKALSYFNNRAGENESSEIKSKVNHAIDILQAKNNKKKGENVKKVKEGGVGADVVFRDGPTTLRFSQDSDIAGDIIIEIYEKGKLLGVGVDMLEFKKNMLNFLKSI